MPPIFAKKPAPGLWRATPPAIFPPILGLLALGLAWRQAGAVFALGPGPGELILGAASPLALLALWAYGAKLWRRPAVLDEDLRVLPGRAGLAAATMTVMLLAAVALTYAPGLALALMALGLGLHGWLGLRIVRGFALAPPEQRRVSPVWHLGFAGFILAALTATPLGLSVLSGTLLFLTLAVALVVWAASAQQFARVSVPAPLRPLLALHPLPASLFATVAAGLDLPILAEGMGLIALSMTAVLLGAARWLTAAGFSALWGAFSLPMAALASAALTLAGLSGGGIWRLLGGLVLVAASLAIPVIAAKVLRLWLRGQLAARTNAAVA